MFWINNSLNIGNFKKSLWDVLVRVYLIFMKNLIEYLDSDGVWKDKFLFLKMICDKIWFCILYIFLWKFLFLYYMLCYSDFNDFIVFNVLYVNVIKKINNYDN